MSFIQLINAILKC